MKSCLTVAPLRCAACAPTGQPSAIEIRDRFARNGSKSRNAIAFAVGIAIRQMSRPKSFMRSQTSIAEFAEHDVASRHEFATLELAQCIVRTARLAISAYPRRTSTLAIPNRSLPDLLRVDALATLGTSRVHASAIRQSSFDVRPSLQHPLQLLHALLDLRLQFAEAARISSGGRCATSSWTTSL